MLYTTIYGLIRLLKIKQPIGLLGLAKQKMSMFLDLLPKTALKKKLTR